MYSLYPALYRVHPVVSDIYYFLKSWAGVLHAPDLALRPFLYLVV